MKNIKGYFITGLLVLIPFVATAAVVWHAFGFLDGWIRYFGITAPGSGIVVLVGVLILTGIIVKNYIGKKLYQLADWLIRKVPLVNILYTTFREVSKTLLDRDKTAFQAVVALEFCGHRTIGFVTGDAPKPIANALPYAGGPVYKMVYVMQAFSPAAGYILMVPEDKLSKVDITIETALKLVLTGGMVRGAESASVE